MDHFPCPGSLFLQERVRALKPQLHLFGHTHFAWDQDFQERRYVSAPLGSPKEWRMRPRSMKLQGGARATRKDGRKEMWERLEEFYHWIPQCLDAWRVEDIIA
eukprot:g22320.t1